MINLLWCGWRSSAGGRVWRHVKVPLILFIGTGVSKGIRASPQVKPSNKMAVRQCIVQALCTWCLNVINTYHLLLLLHLNFFVLSPFFSNLIDQEKKRRFLPPSVWHAVHCTSIGIKVKPLPLYGFDDSSFNHCLVLSHRLIVSLSPKMKFSSFLSLSLSFFFVFSKDDDPLGNQTRGESWMVPAAAAAAKLILFLP